VFDAVGTVIHPEPPAAQVYAEVGRRFGSWLTPDEIAPRFVTAFAREEAEDRANSFRTSEERECERWRHIVGAVLDDVTDPETCFQELFAHFSRPHAWACDPYAAATIRELAERGYVLGMASNYDRRLRSVVAGLKALQSLQHLAISSEIGWRKPAREFFTHLCQTIGLPADRILLVGDDWENDYEGARAAGLHAVLLDAKRKYHEKTTARIMRLNDLLKMQIL
jgi:putative hydrolase of the HAD superfamily